MDLVRTCYVFSARLFKDRPDIVTRLRYFVVPDDTPVYPGWHYYGSATWTADDEAPYVPPLLGEDASLPKVYSKGALGTGIPPAALLGDADCVAAGETFPPAVTGRRFIAGVDSRCWTERGLPLPDQVPFLWLRDTGLRPSPGDGPFTLWEDSAVVPNNCTSFTQPPIPAVTTVGGRRYVFVQGGETVGLGLPFAVGRNFAFHAVVNCLSFFGGTSSNVFVVGPALSQSLLRLTENTWIIRADAAHELVINHGLGWGGPHLYSIRCEDWQLIAHLDGVEVGTLQLSEESEFRCVFGSCGKGSVDGFLFCGLGEAKVYNDWVSGIQYNQDIADLKAYWAIP